MGLYEQFIKKGCDVDVFICAFAFLDLCMEDSINGLFYSIIKEEKYTCEKFQVQN